MEEIIQGFVWPMSPTIEPKAEIVRATSEHSGHDHLAADLRHFRREYCGSRYAEPSPRVKA